MLMMPGVDAMGFREPLETASWPPRHRIALTAVRESRCQRNRGRESEAAPVRERLRPFARESGVAGRVVAHPEPRQVGVDLGPQLLAGVLAGAQALLDPGRQGGPVQSGGPAAETSVSGTARIFRSGGW